MKSGYNCLRKLGNDEFRDGHSWCPRDYDPIFETCWEPVSAGSIGLEVSSSICNITAFLREFQKISNKWNHIGMHDQLTLNVSKSKFLSHLKLKYPVGYHTVYH